MRLRESPGLMAREKVSCLAPIFCTLDAGAPTHPRMTMRPNLFSRPIPFSLRLPSLPASLPPEPDGFRRRDPTRPIAVLPLAGLPDQYIEHFPLLDHRPERLAEVVAFLPKVAAPQPIEETAERLVGDATLGGDRAMRQAGQFGDGVPRRVGRHGVVMEPFGRGNLGGQPGRQEMPAEIEPQGRGRERGRRRGILGGR